MPDTRERLIDAGEKLFAESGYAGTTIAALETHADLAPRTGGFYRHFDSKEALALAVARERVVENAEDLALARFLPLPDLASELALIAKSYLEAAQRQNSRQRLIEELRKIPALREGERQANAQLFALLSEWVASKPAGKNSTPNELASLTMMAFGPILFLATKIREGVMIEAIDQDHFLDHWIEHTRSLLE